MKNIIKKIRADTYHLVLGFLITIGGVYVIHHHDYLDLPRITYPPLPPLEHNFDFMDDLWFGVVLLILGLLMMLLAYLGKYKLAEMLVTIFAGIVLGMAMSFLWRGLNEHFNLTWWLGAIAFWQTTRKLGQGKFGGGKK